MHYVKTTSPFKGLLLGLVLGLPLAALFYLGRQFRVVPFTDGTLWIGRRAA
jgi:hypothetical protein